MDIEKMILSAINSLVNYFFLKENYYYKIDMFRIDATK